MYNLAALINNSGKVAATDKEKLEVLHSLFASVLNGNLSSHISQVAVLQDRD